MSPGLARGVKSQSFSLSSGSVYSPLEHLSLEFYFVSVLEASCALEHLHLGALSVHLYDLRHQPGPVNVDVAELVLGYRTVDKYRDKVGDYAGDNTCGF